MHLSELKKERILWKPLFWVAITVTATVYFFLFQEQNLRAQPPLTLNFEHITSENIRIEKGLSQNSLYCMIQDSRGFLWFGSWDGLNKYDGYNFTVYRPNQHKPGMSVSNMTIQALYEDHAGYIWIGTTNGLNRFDRYKGEFSVLKRIPGDPGSLTGDTINCITEDKKGRLWVGTTNGLSCYNKQRTRFVRFQAGPGSIPGLTSAVINNLQILGDGLWVATDNGLNCIDLNSFSIEQYLHQDSDRNSLCNNVVQTIFADRQGVLWIGTEQGLDSYHVAGHYFQHYPAGPSTGLNHPNIRCIFEDSHRRIWVGTAGGGLNLMSPDRRFFTHYLSDAADPASLSNDYISFIYEDRSGILWIGTSWNGVNKLVKDSQRFEHIKPISNSGNSLSNNLIWCFLEGPDGKLWIGTENGINRFDPVSGKYSYLKSILGVKGTLSDNKIRVFCKDRSGDIWVGTETAGVNRLPKGKTGPARWYLHQADDPGSLGNNSVNAIVEDSKGRIWIGTRGGGLDLYNPKTDHFIHYLKQPGNPSGLSSNVVWSIYEDSRHWLWIGTADGLNVLNPETGKFRVYRHNPGNSNSLSNSNVFSVTEGAPGILWIATVGGGLNRLEIKTGRFISYNESDGLANNVVYNILQDNSGALWMSTNYGLSRFDPATEMFNNFDVKDGVQSNEFNYGAALKMRSGMMLFGGMNGFNVFDPAHIKRNLKVPKVAITGVYVFNNLVRNEFRQGDTLRLDFDQNFLRLEFAALDFTNPTKNKYRYILENINQGWSLADASHHFTEYTDLSPGTYIFRVKGSNNDGVWCDQDFHICIIIKPAWYASFWFRLTSLILLIAVIWWIIYRRIQKLKQKHLVEKRFLTLENQMLDTERKALRLQMNPHFIFNAMNSIQSFVLNNETDQAVHYLGRFSHLMRLILTNSRESMVALSNEMKALEYYLELEKLRFGDKLSYKINVDPGLDPERVEIPPMLIQPYIENAILHGIMHKTSNGHISISLRAEGPVMYCLVEDDGVGRKKSREIMESSGLKRPSQGMFITGKRIELLRKSSSSPFQVKINDILDEEGNIAGTSVQLQIAYKLKKSRNP